MLTIFYHFFHSFKDKVSPFLTQSRVNKKKQHDFGMKNAKPSLKIQLKIHISLELT